MSALGLCVIIRHMRPYGTSAQRAALRKRAFDLLDQGLERSEVAPRVGVTERSVRRWQQEARCPRRKKTNQPLGRPPFLSQKQLRQLETALDQGACAHGYAEDYWTLDRIAHLIWELFGVRYKASGVWRLLQRMGWSSQKPQRQPLERDEEAIRHWKRYVWPQIKRKWHERGATLILPDESGFSLVSPLKRTWARRGHTPVLRTSIEHNARLNLIGAWCVTPAARKIKLHVQSYWCVLTGQEVIAFLKHLLRHVRGPIMLLWDKHPIHKRKIVTQFLERHPRIEVHWFPTCAPELNPMEFVWTQVSESTANTAPHNVMELQTIVRRGVARTRNSQKRLWACVYASDLPWKRKSPKRGH